MSRSNVVFRARTAIKVEVSPGEVIAETIKMFREHFKIDNVDGIDNKGHMFEDVEYATSYSWISRENRGKPTAEQRDAIRAVELLEKLKNSA